MNKLILLYGRHLFELEGNVGNIDRTYKLLYFEAVEPSYDQLATEPALVVKLEH